METEFNVQVSEFLKNRKATKHIDAYSFVHFSFNNLQLVVSCHLCAIDCYNNSKTDTS